MAEMSTSPVGNISTVAVAMSATNARLSGIASRLHMASLAGWAGREMHALVLTNASVVWRRAVRRGPPVACRRCVMDRRTPPVSSI